MGWEKTQYQRVERKLNSRQPQFFFYSPADSSIALLLKDICKNVWEAHFEPVAFHFSALIKIICSDCLWELFFALLSGSEDSSDENRWIAKPGESLVCLDQLHALERNSSGHSGQPDLMAQLPQRPHSRALSHNIFCSPRSTGIAVEIEAKVEQPKAPLAMWSTSANHNDAQSLLMSPSFFEPKILLD